MDYSDNLRLSDQNVSVVYYRAGYRISDYQEDWNAIWKVRELIELSNAVKIPTVTMELYNYKRMQTELSKQETYSQYLAK